ncbi:hypothetical protein ISN45_Aa02g012280 [Arabidopsis thaliana x Arabidopsis arenosa]|uniref:Uncharacterized protein n=1 Tax=Arabidopsis thaliana x Arabidopsis arenosa TaxID=1240361 RepID=A0A8T2BEU7_9BRAS|nr:hypothetical protein ISN45_Aa02g012280 [Arabidopsis thaliana x Arabidopsis arenosa]
MSSKGHHSQQHPLHLNGFTYVVFGTKKHGNGKIDEVERHIESLIWETVKERERECVGLDDYEKVFDFNFLEFVNLQHQNYKRRCLIDILLDSEKKDDFPTNRFM